MIEKITSYRDGGTIAVWVNIPTEYINLFELPDMAAYEICRDFRVGVKTNRCGGSVWLGYPESEGSVCLSTNSKYAPLISWINDRLRLHVKYLQQDIDSFITAQIKLV